ncbi:LOW QUALITY PROTEIN: hypothetical protein MSG28_012032, partial [Choristoneura fumiferana]
MGSKTVIIERLPTSEGPAVEESPRREAAELAFCFSGLMAAYLVWGLLQEKIMTQLLVFINRVLACVVALGRLAWLRAPVLSVPLHQFSYCSLSNIVSAWCQYEALKFVSFPMQHPCASRISMDDSGYREMGWTPSPSYCSQLTNSFSSRTGVISVHEPEKAEECLFVEPSAAVEDALNMYQGFDVLAPDPEAKLTKETLKRSLCEHAFTLGAGRLFDDVECGLISADNIEEHIRSAPDGVYRSCASRASVTDHSGYREMARSSSSASPQAYRSQLATCFTPRTNPIRDEYYPLHTNYKYLINTDKVEGVCDPGIANERVFVGTAPAEYVYRGFHVLAPDPEAKLTKESVRRNLYERAFTLGAARLFDDIECALISADNIEEHIRSAPEGIVNLTLLWAAFLGRDELLPTILSCGANIHSSEPIGLTALHMAAFSDAGKAAMFLLSRGASPDCAPKYFAPLHCAAFGNSLDVAEILFAYGAKTYIKNDSGLTALHLAAGSSSLECVEVLLRYGNADPNAEDSDNRTPLHAAVNRSEHACDIIEVLSCLGAHVNKKDIYGNSSLHIAAIEGLTPCIETLIFLGADVTSKSKKGHTALNIIVKTISHDRAISIFRHNYDCGISFSHCAESKEEVQIEFDFEPLLRFPREIIYLNCLLDEEVSNKNKYSLKSEKGPEIADQNVGMEIKGLQKKIDQTTLNLKKIDQEMRHLNILMKEQQTLLQNWLQNSERAVSCHTPIVLSKSCKVIPVMLMGKAVSGNKYELYEYVTAALISVGMLLFMLTSKDDYSAGRVSLASGIALLALYMCCDSFTASWQARLFVRTRVQPLHMVAGVSLASALLAAAALAAQPAAQPRWQLLQVGGGSALLAAAALARSPPRSHAGSCCRGGGSALLAAAALAAQPAAQPRWQLLQVGGGAPRCWPPPPSPRSPPRSHAGMLQVGGGLRAAGRRRPRRAAAAQPRWQLLLQGGGSALLAAAALAAQPAAQPRWQLLQGGGSALLAAAALAAQPAAQPRWQLLQGGGSALLAAAALAAQPAAQPRWQLLQGGGSALLAAAALAAQPAAQPRWQLLQGGAPALLAAAALAAQPPRSTLEAAAGRGGGLRAAGRPPPSPRSPPRSHAAAAAEGGGSALLAAAALAAQPAAQPRWQLLQHGQFVSDVVLLSLSSAAGQLLIYRTIARFGAVAFTIIMTLRQHIIRGDRRRVYSVRGSVLRVYCRSACAGGRDCPSPATRVATHIATPTSRATPIATHTATPTSLATASVTVPAAVMCACRQKKSFFIEDILKDAKKSYKNISSEPTEPLTCTAQENAVKYEGDDLKDVRSEREVRFDVMCEVDKELEYAKINLEHRRNTFPLYPTALKPSSLGHRTGKKSFERQFNYYTPKFNTMECINKLEKEIVDLRKILVEKENELYELKKKWVSKPHLESQLHVNSDGFQNQTKVDRLPKWAIESRQILLPEIGVEGQVKLCAARVLVVGAGGLGCPAAVYLAGAGVGEIGLVDYDTVDLTNIHRQFLHTENDQHQSKLPLISGSALKMEGQLTVYGYRDSNPVEK